MLSCPPTPRDVRAARELLTHQRETGVSDKDRARLFAMGALTGPPYELTARGRLLLPALLSLLVCGCGGDPFEYVEAGAAQGLAAQTDVRTLDAGHADTGQADSNRVDTGIIPIDAPPSDAPTLLDAKSADALDAGDVLDAHETAATVDVVVDVAPPPMPEAAASRDAPAPSTLCCNQGSGSVEHCTGSGFSCYAPGSSCTSISCSQGADGGGFRCVGVGCPSGGPSCSSSPVCAPGAICTWIDSAGDTLPGTVGVCP